MAGRIKLLLLGARWRKGGQSGLHWRGSVARGLGLVPDDFAFALSEGLIRRYPSGYCRLLAMGYRLLDEWDVRWPADTSFPRTGLCDPPDMHQGLPGSDTGRCGCPVLVDLS
jgi:hypothetical protein